MLGSSIFVRLVSKARQERFKLERFEVFRRRVLAVSGQICERFAARACERSHVSGHARYCLLLTVPKLGTLAAKLSSCWLGPSETP